MSISFNIYDNGYLINGRGASIGLRCLQNDLIVIALQANALIDWPTPWMVGPLGIDPSYVFARILQAQYTGGDPFVGTLLIWTTVAKQDSFYDISANIPDVGVDGNMLTTSVTGATAVEAVGFTIGGPSAPLPPITSVTTIANNSRVFSYFGGQVSIMAPGTGFTDAGYFTEALHAGYSNIAAYPAGTDVSVPYTYSFNPLVGRYWIVAGLSLTDGSPIPPPPITASNVYGGGRSRVTVNTSVTGAAKALGLPATVFTNRYSPVTGLKAVLSSGINVFMIPPRTRVVTVELPAANTVPTSLLGSSGDAGLALEPKGGFAMFVADTLTQVFILTAAGQHTGETRIGYW